MRAAIHLNYAPGGRVGYVEDKSGLDLCRLDNHHDWFYGPGWSSCRVAPGLGERRGFNRNVGAYHHGVPLPTTEDERVWRPHFDLEVLHGADFVFSVDVDKGVGIYPIQLCHDSGNRYRFFRIILGIKGVMRHERLHRQKRYSECK